MITKKVLTLCLIQQGDKVLLGMKKRGVGVGKWNGFGGKVNPDEGIEEAVRREVQEEANITASDIEKVGYLEFVWRGREQEVWQVHVFKAVSFTGNPEETDEMKPQWFHVKDVPFDQMWPDDKYWFPLFLEGKKFEGDVFLDEKDQIINYSIRETL